MRIATYNLRMGGSQRCHWRKMIEDHSVDLLLVQESYPAEEHLPPLLFPHAQEQSVWAEVSENRWGSAVFSTSGSLTPVELPEFAGWVVGAEITGADWMNGLCDSILVFSVHVPSRGISYAKEVNCLLDEICQIAGQREIIIGGDFNLTVSNWSGSERPVSRQDLAVQARLADQFGLLNCWQTANPDQPLEQTLRWSRDPTVPYHCDGIFVPRKWQDRLHSCVVLSGKEWNHLSDHNPVVACFLEKLDPDEVGT